jgi:hypothetical protein
MTAPDWPTAGPDEATEPDRIWGDLVTELADQLVDGPEHTAPDDIRFDLSVCDGPWFDQRLIDDAEMRRYQPDERDPDEDDDTDENGDDDTEDDGEDQA